MPQALLTGEQRRQIDEDGFAVLPGILSDDECDAWSTAIDDMWIQDQNSVHDYTEEPGVQFTDNLLRFSAIFEKALIEPIVVEGVRQVLGQDVIVTLVNGRRSDPGFGRQPLHELNRRRGKPFLTCNTIWCLDEFTTRNGATRVIPGSHLSAEPFLSRMVDPLDMHPDETTVVAPRGAVAVFNSHLLHAGGMNTTELPRRCVHGQFTLTGETPHYDWHRLPEHILAALSAASHRMLGLTVASS